MQMFLRSDDRMRRSRALTLVVVAGLFVVVPAMPAFARAVPGTIVSSWTVAAVHLLPTGIADQGVATVTAAGKTVVITRGHAIVPPALRAQGWVHVGDPDSRGGLVLDTYQGTPTSHAKLFTITSATGAVGYYQHQLTSSENYHNSFAAFTPDSQYFVAGQWGTTTQLQVFRTPPTQRLGSAAAPIDLPLAGTIDLPYPIRNVQGCVFASATTLMCTTNDTHTDLYPVSRQLLSLRLSTPLTIGRATAAATPHLLGQVPQDPTCPMPGESEGLDLSGTTLRIIVNSPCRQASLMTTYSNVTHIDDDD